jgi:hypothetical protein
LTGSGNFVQIFLELFGFENSIVIQRSALFAA